jgi:KilA-N domain
MTLIQHLYQGIAIDQRDSDGYINLNQMADATGKRVQNWKDNLETQELIAEFESDHHSNSSDVPALITDKTRADFGGGTWAHPDIAIQFAQWCSPSFALQVSRWVRQWLTRNSHPDQWQLYGMTEYELKLLLLKAKNWGKTVEIALDSHKVRRLTQAIEEEKARKQLEITLDNEDKPDDEGDEEASRD